MLPALSMQDPLLLGSAPLLLSSDLLRFFLLQFLFFRVLFVGGNSRNCFCFLCRHRLFLCPCSGVILPAGRVLIVFRCIFSVGVFSGNTHFYNTFHVHIPYVL